jgi:two-component system sensor histidine kinase QseC
MKVMKHLTSLRARLLWMISGGTFLIWSIAGIASYYQTLHEMSELMDGQLALAGKLLLAQAGHDRDVGRVAAHAVSSNNALIEVLENEPNHPYEQRLRYQVWEKIEQKYSHLLLRSVDAPTTMLHLQVKVGYADIQQPDQFWRIFTLPSSNGRFLVQVAHPTSDRERVALEVAEQLALPILLALPVLYLLVYFAVVQGMRPLDQLASEIGERSSDNLDPLSVLEAPKETLPLLTALNRLLIRLALALDNERRFTADAAHELRTPLAAVKVQAQVALASIEPADHQHALRQVLAGADRATRLVEQLLRLARLDPLANLTNARPFNLSGVAIEQVESLRLKAEDQAQHLTFVAPETPVEICGDVDLLCVAIRNLLENALRYTPAQSTIALGIERKDGRPILWVRDSGPGVDAEDLPHLVERFYRGKLSHHEVAYTASSEGSGLGLAIVQRIAELHGAVLEVSNLPQGGFEARLRWL